MAAASKSSELAPAAGFILRIAVWVAAFFGFLRVPWVQDTLLIPFAGFQGDVACSLAGTPRGSVFVDMSCTGSDAMALCLGAVFAFPSTWRRRLIGGFAGLFLIVIVNTIRIGSVSRVVGDRELFELLHVYVWPAIIIVVASVYVFMWMRFFSGTEVGDESSSLRITRDSRRAWRFAATTIALVTGYYAISPWLYQSAVVLGVARWAARTAGMIMNGLGVEAVVKGNFLRTSEGAWIVTHECVTTPLIPIFLAAVLSVRLSPWKRLVGVGAALPLFTLLGTARLLVLALPKAIVGSHEIAIHAFYQMLLGVAALAIIARGADRPLGKVASALGAGFGVGVVGQLLFVYVDRPILEGLRGLHLGHAWVDDQGALTILSAYQLGLWVALWWVSRPLLDGRRFWAGAGVLIACQVALVVVLGELAVHLELAIPVVGIRALGIAGPLLTRGWLLNRGRQLQLGDAPLPQHG
ncbi:MAG: archaeosortase/exosortase family protein [Acidobacteriota bacterium]|nr:archaeosortase/exosortase family protein [Acidobacteriota bacterium]